MSDVARTEGERIRLREAIPRMRALLDSLEVSLRYEVPIIETGHALVQAAGTLATTCAKHDAYLLVEKGIP